MPDFENSDWFQQWLKLAKDNEDFKKDEPRKNTHYNPGH